MIASVIAKRYAEGYLGYCRETIGLRNGLEQFLQFRETAARIPELGVFLTSGAIGVGEKRAFIDTILRRYFAGEFCDFVEFLLERQRIQRLGDIAEYAVTAYLHEEQHVILETANMLDTDSLRRLKIILEEKLGRPVRIYMNFDSELIGGFRVSMNNTVIDATLRRCMSDLRSKLKKTKVKENEPQG